MSKGRQVNNVTKRKAEGKPTIPVTVITPEDIYHRMKNLSFQKSLDRGCRVSFQSIWIEAASEYLERHENKADAA